MASRTREKSLARDGFNDFWGLLVIAPFLRMGEGGRGGRGIFKPLLSVGTLFSGALVVALSPQLLPPARKPKGGLFRQYGKGRASGAVGSAGETEEKDL